MSGTPGPTRERYEARRGWEGVRIRAWIRTAHAGKAGDTDDPTPLESPRASRLACRQNSLDLAARPSSFRGFEPSLQARDALVFHGKGKAGRGHGRVGHGRRVEGPPTAVGPTSPPARSPYDFPRRARMRRDGHPKGNLPTSARETAGGCPESTSGRGIVFYPPGRGCTRPWLASAHRSPRGPSRSTRSSIAPVLHAPQPHGKIARGRPLAPTPLANEIGQIVVAERKRTERKREKEKGERWRRSTRRDITMSDGMRDGARRRGSAWTPDLLSASQDAARDRGENLARRMKDLEALVASDGSTLEFGSAMLPPPPTPHPQGIDRINAGHEPNGPPRAE